MRTRLTLRPHQRGAKQLLAEYGSRLVCVRYRYDEHGKKRWKTVELIVEEKDWEPPLPQRPADSLVQLRVEWAETAVRHRIKAAGGKWDPVQSVWELRYDQAIALGFAKRIVAAPSSIHI